MKRTLSLFLALVLAAALLVCPAAAAEAAAPWVEVNSGTVTVRGLSEAWNGIQLTLQLDKAAETGIFTFDAALSNGQIYSVSKAEGDSLTLYLTAKTPLGAEGSLCLGALDRKAGVRSASGLRMASIDAGREEVKSIAYDSVRVTVTGTGTEDPDPTPTPTPPAPPIGGGGSGGGSSVSSHAVKAAVSDGGALKLSTTDAAKGETVTITVTPNTGYVLQSLTVADSKGKTVAVTDLGEGKWSFTMPNADVTVTASFAAQAQEALPFTDVGEDDWFREAVDYVYREGLMNGTGQTLFSPHNTTTRGMVVTILYRFEGAPETGGSQFRDVPPDQYYARPVAWAAANGVVNGYEDGLFKPDEQITREQMAVILYRYARQKGLDVSGSADLSGYADASQISGYAREAMAWANHVGLINGVGNNTLLPRGSATRAQVAAILMRFCKNIAQQSAG